MKKKEYIDSALAPPHTTPFSHLPKIRNIKLLPTSPRKNQKRGSSAATFFFVVPKKKVILESHGWCLSPCPSPALPSRIINPFIQTLRQFLYLRIAAQAPDAQNEKYPSHTPPYNDNYHDINCLSVSDSFDL